jgi:hypothetical protein
MSIPVRFSFYDRTGNLLDRKSIFTISYGQNSGDLNLLASRLGECTMEMHQKYIHEDVRYAVPDTAPDYMFDLKEPAAIIPNRFKEQQ